MLLDLCRECRNFFTVSKETGVYEINNNVINLKDDYLIGQWIAIDRKKPHNPGSILNAGLYKISDNLYTLENTVDEIFVGAIYGMAVPAEFEKLAEEISKFIAATPDTSISSYRFGVSSVTMATKQDGTPLSWRDVYYSRLAPFKRMFMDINI